MCCKTYDTGWLFRWKKFFFGLDETKIEHEHTLSQQELWHGRLQQRAQVPEIGDRILSQAHEETFHIIWIKEMQIIKEAYTSEYLKLKK